MLNHPTLDKLEALRFNGMVKALTEQMALPDIEELSFEERLGLLVDREMTEREDRRLKTRLRQAKLRQSACVEDIDYRHPRGLDKSLMLDLAGCQWIKRHLNIMITGPTGVGKTWIACALAQKACREGYRALYPPAKINAGTTHCQGRRHVYQAADPTGQDRRADPGRLGSVKTDG